MASEQALAIRACNDAQSYAQGAAALACASRYLDAAEARIGDVTYWGDAGQIARTDCAAAHTALAAAGRNFSPSDRGEIRPQDRAQLTRAVGAVWMAVASVEGAIAGSPTWPDAARVLGDAILAAPGVLGAAVGQVVEEVGEAAGKAVGSFFAGAWPVVLAAAVVVALYLRGGHGGV